jgi:hypothetical protein
METTGIAPAAASTAGLSLAFVSSFDRCYGDIADHDPTAPPRARATGAS